MKHRSWSTLWSADPTDFESILFSQLIFRIGVSSLPIGAGLVWLDRYFRLTLQGSSEPILLPRQLVMLICLLVATWLATLLISRTGHSKAAALTLVFGLTMGVYGVMYNTHNLAWGIYLVLPFLCTGILLRGWMAITILVINLGLGILSIFMLAPVSISIPEQAGFVGFLSLVALMVLILSSYRDQLEAYRRSRAADVESAFQNLIEPSTVQSIFNPDVDRRQAMRAVRLSAERYQAIIDDQSELIYRYHPDHTVSFANNAFCRFFDRDRKTLIGKTFIPQYCPDDEAKIQQFHDQLTSDNPMGTLEYRVITPDGEARWLQTTERVLFDEHGSPLEYQTVSRDVTSTKQTEEALRQSEEHFRALVALQGEGIVLIEPGYRIDFANPAAGNILGVPHEELAGRKLTEFITDEQLKQLREQLQNLADEKIINLEFSIHRPDGQIRELLVTVSPWLDAQQKTTSALCVVRDITDRKRVEEQLRYIGSHDVLTGLYNRSYFEEEMARLSHGRAYPISLVMMDLDGLKDTNDRLGHLAGDDLLYRTALILRSSFRAEDVVARIGGDEFTVLLPQTDIDDVLKAVYRLRRTLAISQSTENKESSLIRLSIGVATAYPGDDLQEALKKADQAMYADKAEHRGRLPGAERRR